MRVGALRAAESEGVATPSKTPLGIGNVRNVSYDKYIAWRRLTHNGQRSREEMSPASRAEYDSYGFREAPAPDLDEATRLYAEARGCSHPTSGGL